MRGGSLKKKSINIKIPSYVLSFDPGGSSSSWAYCISTVQNNKFLPLEVGYAPTISNKIANPDFTELKKFKNTLYTKYPNMDLVAERFMGRGFGSWLTEFIGFHLGWWASSWEDGNVRFIMASQWKQKAKKFKPFVKTGKYENWWEWDFKDVATEQQQKKGVIHLQDAICIGWWFWKYQLTVEFNEIQN